MKKIVLLLSMIAFGFVSFAQKQTPPEGGIPKDFKLPAKKEGQLKNGLRSTLVQYGALPKVNVSLMIKTGNVHEAANQVWLADLVVDLMKQGTASMNFETISKKIAAMGGNINISAGMDQVTISGSVLSEFAPDLITVMADMVINPAFPEKDLDRLKADMKRQLSVQKSVPQSLAREKFFDVIYKDHPYGRIYPTEAMVDSYNLAMVKDFYDQNFGAKRSVIYVVGKFDEAGVTKSITESFDKWKEGPDISYPPAVAKQSNEISIIDRAGAPQSTIIIGLPTLDPSKPDYQALLITNSLLVDLLVHVLQAISVKTRVILIHLSAVFRQERILPYGLSLLMSPANIPVRLFRRYQKRLKSCQRSHHPKQNWKEFNDTRQVYLFYKTQRLAELLVSLIFLIRTA